jgi:hypothetical protein
MGISIGMDVVAAGLYGMAWCTRNEGDATTSLNLASGGSSSAPSASHTFGFDDVTTGATSLFGSPADSQNFVDSSGAGGGNLLVPWIDHAGAGLSHDPVFS